jgi:hypothetical protein
LLTFFEGVGVVFLKNWICGYGIVFITFICGAESSGAVEEVSPKLVKKLTNEIIGAGLTQKQFNALLAQLRDSISFK